MPEVRPRHTLFKFQEREKRKLHEIALAKGTGLHTGSIHDTDTVVYNHP